jgi:hypothetical protein
VSHGRSLERWVGAGVTKVLKAVFVCFLGCRFMQEQWLIWPDVPIVHYGGFAVGTLSQLVHPVVMRVWSQLVDLCL